MAFARGRRVPARPRSARQLPPKPFVAPTLGWVSAANLAAAPAGSAQILENWYPTSTGIRMRGGARKHGTAAAAQPLESLISYIGATSRKMFAGANGTIVEMTSPASPTAVPAAAVSGQTGNYYSHVNFVTSGGHYMLVANGINSMRLYDGATWTALTAASSPAITGVLTSKISHVGVYRQRVWMVESGSMNAWYLPTDSIAGAAAKHTLAGVFRNGGSLLFTATWSLDAGDGLDDKIVFVSTEGEVAVYQGDPANPSEWGLVGRYDASPALGKNASINVGGDLLILTEIGLVPLSAIINKDPGALALAAVSRNIQPDWEREARQRRTIPWEIVKWTSRNIAYVTCPMTADQSVTPPICFAVNLETGAWSKVTGWDTRCTILHDDQVYMGSNTGALMQVDVSGSDDGSLIYHTYVGQPDHLGRIGQMKTARQARAIFRSKAEFNPQISVCTDYQIELPAFPSAAIISGTPGEWDVGLWDVSKWDTGRSFYTAQTQWVSIGASGFVHAPVLQIVSGSASQSSAELVVFEVMFEPGGYAV